MPARALIAAVLAMLLPCAPLAAANDRTFVTLSVNAQDRGEIVVFLRPPDILMRASDLTRAGIAIGPAANETIDGERYVSLAALHDVVTFAFDEDATTLALTAVPRALAAHDIDLAPRIERVPVDYANRSGYLTYALSGEAGQPLQASLQTGVHALGGFFSSGGSFAGGNRFAPSLTSLGFDDQVRMRRTTFGDAAVDTGDLGGAPVIAGFTVARDFALDPAAVTYGRPAARGEALYPSTADVYVNGVLVRSVRLAPGAYDLRDIPILTGTNDTRVVVRDAFGNQRVIDQGFYASASLLAHGTSDYSYSAGALQTTNIDGSVHLEGAAAAARYRIGLTDGLTLGGRFEGDTHLASGGGAVDVRLPRGVAHLSFGASRDGTSTGHAAELSYELTGRRIYVTGALRTMSSRYADLSLEPGDDRSMSDITLRTGTSTGRHADVAISYSSRSFRDAGRISQLSVQNSIAVRPDINAIVTLTRASSPGGRHLEVFSGLSFATGARSSASISTATATGPVLQLERSAPVGVGVGYQTTIAPASAVPLSGTVTANGSLADAQIVYSATGGTLHADATVSGSIVAIGSQVRLSRPVDQSYALVEVPGASNVHVFLENQEVGRTDRNGNLLVTSLLPYYANHVSIADLDTPLSTSVASVDHIVAPAEHGGTVIRFPTTTIAAFVGRIAVTQRGKPVSAGYGELVLGSTAVMRSDLADDGSFYFENLVPGTYPARVNYAGGSCLFRVTVPPGAAIRTNLGVLTCAV